jgi:hypothetical protein
MVTRPITTRWGKAAWGGGVLVNLPAASIELCIIRTEYIHCQPAGWLIGGSIDYSNPGQLIN